MQLTGIDGVCTVVTGAAGGIGSAVVAKLVQAGAQVLAVDRDRDGLDDLLSGLPDATAHRVTARSADVGEPGAVGDILDGAEQEFGPLGLLVSAAGELRSGPVSACPDEDWHRLLHTNATGVFVWARAAAQRMIRHGQGAIVTVASNAVGVPRAGLAAYAASKAAARALTLGLGLELAPHGVRCNVLCPGSTDTAMLRQLAGEDTDFDALVHGDPEAFRTGIPLGRVAVPGDIADAVLFLASDQARHITLHSLYVDGGAALSG